MWTSHLIGTGLVAAAFLLFAREILKKEKGKQFNPLPTFLLLLVSIIFQLTYPQGSFWLRIPHFLLDTGIGMAIASAWLAVNRSQPKLFLLPGLLSVFAGSFIYLLAFAYHSLTNQEPAKRGDAIELLVELGEDDFIDEKALQELLHRHHAVAELAFPMVDFSEDKDLSKYYLVFVPAHHAQRLQLELEADTENVDQVAPNGVFDREVPSPGNSSELPLDGLVASNDPYFGKQWYAQALSYEQVYAFLGNHGPRKKAKVAIVDTGVDRDHEDLAAVYQKSNTDGDYDKHSHGSHCAGLAGAIANNGKGIGSMNWEGKYLTLTGYAALDDYGRGSDLRVSRAIIQAAEDGADVISMSLGGPSLSGRPPKSQVDAIRYARKRGAIVIVAAGNSNADASRFSPANVEGVICVSAVGPDLRKASFSNTNTTLKMPIAAPGVNILSSTPGSQYQSYNGTSMATPIVSGLVGMMRSLRPDVTAEEAYELLVSTGMPGEDAAAVGRLIQPAAALQALIAE